MADDQEIVEIVKAPPFVQACRVLDHLWMAANALEHCHNREAGRMAGELDLLRRRFEETVLPKLLRQEVLG